MITDREFIDHLRAGVCEARRDLTAIVAHLRGDDHDDFARQVEAIADRLHLLHLATSPVAAGSVPPPYGPPRRHRQT